MNYGGGWNVLWPNHLPEHILHIWHNDDDNKGYVQMYHWNGSSWIFDSLVSQAGEQADGVESDYIEFRVSKSARTSMRGSSFY